MHGLLIGVVFLEYWLLFGFVVVLMVDVSSGDGLVHDGGTRVAAQRNHVHSRARCLQGIIFFGGKSV